MHAVAAEAGMRVAVDEAGDRGEPATVDLLDVAEAAGKLAHRPDRLDAAVSAEDERVRDDLERRGVRPRAAGRRARPESRAGPGRG